MWLGCCMLGGRYWDISICSLLLTKDVTGFDGQDRTLWTDEVKRRYR